MPVKKRHFFLLRSPSATGRYDVQARRGPSSLQSCPVRRQGRGRKERRLFLFPLPEPASSAHTLRACPSPLQVRKTGSRGSRLTHDRPFTRPLRPTFFGQTDRIPCHLRDKHLTRPVLPLRYPGPHIRSQAQALLDSYSLPERCE